MLNVGDLISEVHFAPPFTIVKWKNGEATVVKCMDGDEFIEEVGLAEAITKKLFNNNRGELHRILKSAKRYTVTEGE